MPTKTQKKYVPGSLGKYFAMFVAPALIVYLVFSIVPFLFTIYYSFTDYTDMNPVNLHFTGLANYIKVLGSPLMRTAIKNSLIYAVVLTGAQLHIQDDSQRQTQHDLLFPGGILLVDHRLPVELYPFLLQLRPYQQPAG